VSRQEKDKDYGKELDSDTSAYCFQRVARTTKQGYEPDNEEDRSLRSSKPQEGLREKVCTLVLNCSAIVVGCSRQQAWRDFGPDARSR
jgi:hypothetical protein